jgi:putative transposase
LCLWGRREVCSPFFAFFSRNLHGYHRSGILWEGRYKASLVGCERHVFICYRYIELNPVRAEMVSDPADYRWSSYRRNAGGGADAVVTEHAEYTALGGSLAARCEAYRELFRVDLDAEVLGEIRDNLNRCRALGSERFKDEIEAALHRKLRPGKAGRPKNARLISWKSQSNPYSLRQRRFAL